MVETRADKFSEQVITKQIAILRYNWITCSKIKDDSATTIRKRAIDRMKYNWDKNDDFRIRRIRNVNIRRTGDVLRNYRHTRHSLRNRGEAQPSASGRPSRGRLGKHVHTPYHMAVSVDLGDDV